MFSVEFRNLMVSLKEVNLLRIKGGQPYGIQPTRHMGGFEQ